MSTRGLVIELARTQQDILRLRRRGKERFGIRDESYWSRSWRVQMLELKDRARDLRRRLEQAA